MKNKSKIDFKKIDNFFGSRKECLAFINDFEKDNRSVMLKKNITGEDIECNMRRLDTFSALGIFPKEIEDRESMRMKGWELKYDDRHLYRYFLAMHLRKNNFKLEKIAEMMLDRTDDWIKKSAVEYFITSPNLSFPDHVSQENFQLSKTLRKLGRTEGRPLKSTQIRFAITPWFHAYVSEKELKKLSKDDISALTMALDKVLKSHIS